MEEINSNSKIDPTDRIHTSNDPDLVFEDVPLYNQSKDSKPLGLWYSFGRQWFEFCKESSGFCLRKYTYKLNITDCNIITIDSLEKFRNFENKYGYKQYRNSRYYTVIDWFEVAEEYDGIEIYDPEDYTKLKDLPYSSYIHEPTSWYYHWDIGSGCIWKKCKVTLDKLYFEPKLKNKKAIKASKTPEMITQEKKLLIDNQKLKKERLEFIKWKKSLKRNKITDDLNSTNLYDLFYKEDGINIRKRKSLGKRSRSKGKSRSKHKSLGKRPRSKRKSCSKHKSLGKRPRSKSKNVQ